MRATVVIPAYNEAKRIGRVLEAVAGAELVDEVIVVDDGSRDRTAEVAAAHDGAMVVRLPRNQGKAGALWEGVRRARNKVAVFLDADLVGLTADHVDDLVRPVVGGEADMAVGQFRGGSRWITLWQRLVPSISGQRAISTEHFLSIPRIERTGFGVEVALTRYAARNKLATRRVLLAGMSHVIKEEKRGILRGVYDRAVMYTQIVRCALGNGYHALRTEAEEIRRG
jgi:glycosyltransferase involved in cell wall biosynthesis